MARKVRTVIVGIIIAALMTEGANACAPPPKFNVNDIESAEIVVVGSIVNYRFVKDLEARERRIQMLENFPAQQKYYLENPDLGHAADYARFEIEIHEVILGPTQKTISAVWSNNSFGIYETYPTGPFLIALHSLPTPFQLQNIQSPAVNADLGPDPWYVLQALCSQPFIISTGGPTEAKIRGILAAKNKMTFTNFWKFIAFWK